MIPNNRYKIDSCQLKIAIAQQMILQQVSTSTWYLFICLSGGCTVLEDGGQSNNQAARKNVLFLVGDDLRPNIGSYSQVKLCRSPLLTPTFLETKNAKQTTQSLLETENAKQNTKFVGNKKRNTKLCWKTKLFWNSKHRSTFLLCPRPLCTHLTLTLLPRPVSSSTRPLCRSPFFQIDL